jgi:thiamine pyrophosphokinase
MNLIWVMPAEGAAMGQSVLIITGAQEPIDIHADLIGVFRTNATLVIAVDGGLDRALLAGIDVDLIVGDLDSVSPGAIARAHAAGVTVEKHPVDKDATDLELALERAIARGVTEIFVIGGQGDRFDHLAGELSVLASSRWRPARITAVYGTARLDVLHDGANLELAATTGSLISLIPTNADVSGVTTTGLVFALHDEVLRIGETRGVSNRFATPTAAISLRMGTLLVIQPFALREHERGA